MDDPHGVRNASETTSTVVTLHIARNSATRASVLETVKQRVGIERLTGDAADKLNHRVRDEAIRRLIDAHRAQYERLLVVVRDELKRQEANR